MTVEQLIEELQQFPPSAEVRIASQPSWPFEYAIQGVVGVEEEIEILDEDDYALLPPQNEDEEPPKTIYIVEGSQLGYLPGNAAAEIGW